MSPAAGRLNDPIAHPPLWASIGKMVGGLLIAAAVGAAAGAAATFVVGTGGLGALVLGAVLSSGIMALVGVSLIGALTEGLNNAMDMLFPPVVCGLVLMACSWNVHINGIPAAHAIPSNLSLCSNHPPAPLVSFLAEGSDNVFINDEPAHRVGDRHACGAKTNSGSSNVFIGGGALQIAEIAPDVPPWLQHVGTALGIATALCTRDWKSIPGKVACLGVTMGIGMAADAAVNAAIGHPVHAASGAKILDGEDDADFALPARLPLEWVRRYNSMDARVGLFGPGWSTPVSVQLKLHAPGAHPVLFIDEMGREVPFESLRPGQSLTNIAEGLRLCCTAGGHYVLETDDGGLYYDFGPARQPGPHTLELLGLEDRNGNAIQLNRDGTGRLLGMSDSAGRHYRCHYDAAHPERLSGIELDYGEPSPDGPDWLARYTYDQSGRLSSVADRTGAITRRFTWHGSGPGRGLMASHSLPDGLTAHYRWDKFNDHPRVVEQWDDLGNRWHIEYDTTGGTTSATDQLGRTQTWRWDARYALTGHTDAAGNAWAIEWNSDGQIACAVQPNGGRWQFEYDTRGNLSCQSDPTGAAIRTRWKQGYALPESETDALGNQTTWRYDEWGNLLGITDAAGETTWALDRHGQPVLRTAANGSTVKWAWNASGQVTHETDCSGNITRYDYDRDGNLLCATDPLGNATRYQHDPLGRLVKAELPDGTARGWAWDAAGQLARAIDGKGGEAAFERAQGRLLRRTDAAGRIVAYQYDAPGNLTAIANENGERISFEHDPAGRLVAQVGLDGKRTETTLDALGLPTRVIEAAGTPHALTTDLERDLLGRLLKKTTPESITTYSRDALGRVAGIARTDLSGKPLDSLEFGFDAQGNLITETQALWRSGNGAGEAVRHTLAHAYDPLGNRIATTLPDGRVLNHLLYGSGHLHQINLDGRVICDFERDALHRETARSQGGLSLRTQYDPLSRVLSRASRPLIQHAPASGGLDKRYRYDANGELSHRADAWLGEVALWHDPTGRILSARSVKAGKAPAVDEQHSYDEAGNLLNPWGEGRGFVRHNRLEVFEDKRYQYDEYGRLVEKRIGRHTSVHLRWNREHQLVESTVEKNGARQHSRYEYDALGRRVMRRDTFTEARFIWDGMRLLQESRGHQNSTYVYQPDIHEPVARIDATETPYRNPGTRADVYHFHTHINGAPEEMTDEAGQTLWRARYRTWGSLALEEADERRLPSSNQWDKQATRQPVRMQGQYADSETGLYYNTFRYYDPDIGRFISEDPIGLMGGLNLYGFAANADRWVDPWGWNAKPETAAAFEERISKMPPGERVVAVRGKAAKVARKNDWVKDPSLSQINGRDVYRTQTGELRAVDTQHGRIEYADAKGRHLGEFDIDGQQKKRADKSGRHKLRGC
jgi:RHS repeat-associated protein